MLFKNLFPTGKKNKKGLILIFFSITGFLIYRYWNSIKTWFVTQRAANHNFDGSTCKTTKEDYYDHIIKWEGGQSDNDTGSAFAPGTEVNVNKGVTWDTYENFKNSKGEIPNVQEFLEMPLNVWGDIADISYWDKWSLDDLHHCKIRYIVHAYAWGSGNAGSERMLANWVRANYNRQELDSMGVVNYYDITKPEMIKIFNEWNPDTLFDLLVEERKRLFTTFATYPIYGNGWNNRINGLVELIN